MIILQARPKLKGLKPFFWLFTFSLTSYPVKALPTWPMRLERRTPVLKDSGLMTIDGKVPMDLIILIAVTMFFAIVCLLITLLNLRRPWVAGSKEITEERRRAKTDLRLRGAGVGTGKKFMIDRKQVQPQFRNNNEPALSHLSIDSKSQLLSPLSTPDIYQKPVSNHVGPRVAQDQQSRAARGYSFYSKAELASMAGGYKNGDIRLAKPQAFVGGPRQFQSPAMMNNLAVPTLSQTDYISDTSSTAYSSPDPSSSNSGKSSEGNHSNGGPIGPRPLPNHARLQKAPSHSRHVNNKELGMRRVSSTSAGALRWHERDQYVPEMPTTTAPAMINRAYSNDRVSPSRGNGIRLVMQRGMNEDYQSPYRTSGYFDGSISDGHYSGSHEGSGSNTPSKQHPLQSFAQIPRTKPLGFYDNEYDSNQSNHLTGLLDNRNQTQMTANSTWRGYL